MERFEALEEEKQELFRSTHRVPQAVLVHVADHSVSGRRPGEAVCLYPPAYSATAEAMHRPGVVFDDEVNLKFYRLQKTSEGSISLAAREIAARSVLRRRWERAWIDTSRSSCRG